MTKRRTVQARKSFDSRKRFIFSTLLVLLLANGADCNQDTSSWKAPVSGNIQHHPPLFSRLRRWSRQIREGSLPGSKSSSPLRENRKQWNSDAAPRREGARDEEGGDSNNHLIMYDREEEAEAEYSNVGSNQNLIPLITGALDSLLSDPQRLAQWSLKAVQYSLIWYLSKAVWKALNEVLEEANSQSSLSGDPNFCSRSDIPRILKALENPIGLSATSNTEFAHNVMAVQLAMDLWNAGMPLRSTSRSSIESLFQTLTKSEASILRQCLWKPTPGVHRELIWDQIAGLDTVKEQLLVTLAGFRSDISGSSRLEQAQKAFAPLLKSHSTTSHHVGILLSGPPGCGKTMLAKALAAKLGLTCLVVTPSVLMRKYVGETNLQVRSLFSLLPKLDPCMVVLDELDGLFRERHDQEHDSSRELKTEFLQWLSGIMTSNGGNHKNALVVVGATNRPFDVDAAILRRLPQRFYVGLPDYMARCQLLHTLLSEVPTGGDLNLGELADQLNGYTPSDIHQVLQTAVRVGPLQETLKSLKNPLYDGTRPLTNNDIMNAISQTQPTPLSPRYRNALELFTNTGRPGGAGNFGGESYYIDNYHVDFDWEPGEDNDDDDEDDFDDEDDDLEEDDL